MKIVQPMRHSAGGARLGQQRASFDDVERTSLHEGDAQISDEWHSVVEPVVSRYGDVKIHRYFRDDAGFTFGGEHRRPLLDEDTHA